MAKKKYFFTPEMDQHIRDLYLSEVGIKATAFSGPVKALAAKFDIPRFAVSNRARKLGILPLQKKEPDWSEKELYILERNSHLTAERVQPHLKRAGFHRTVQGIMVKRKRLRISRTCMDGYNVNSLSECFGIDAHSIIRWIQKGWLKARRRGTARTAKQGGDEYYITEGWVRDFVIKSVAVIDFRKVDKYWLIGLLAGDSLIGNHMQIKTENKYEDVDQEVLGMFEEAHGMV